MKIKLFSLITICLFFFSCASFELGNLHPKSRRAKFVASNPNLFPEIKEAILNGNLMIGMTPAQVVASIGRPYDVNMSSGSWGVHEQWVMCAPNSRRDWRYGYVYFENGRVVSWQSRIF